MSTVTTPAPSQRSHLPPGALKLNAPFSRPRAFAEPVRARSVRISSQAFVYVAAFERDERPSGDWSTRITSAMPSSPSIASCAPTSSTPGRSPFPMRCRAPAASTSTTSDDFPEPDTPDTATSWCSGKSTEMF